MSGGTGADTFVFNTTSAGDIGHDIIFDLGIGGADRLRLNSTVSGYTQFADFDVTGNGIIDAADAGLTDKVAIAPDGSLILFLDHAETNSVTLYGVPSILLSDFDL